MSGAPFTFGSLCSGIEAASEAFLPLGAECRYVAEIEPFPCAVLADRHGAGRPLRMPIPEEAKSEKERRARVAARKTIGKFDRWGTRVPNLGDLTQIQPEELAVVDLLVAGAPCQDFSIAGLRQSLSGARGNLTMYLVKLIHELVRLRRIRSVLYEQVPDILNTKDNAFGAFLGGIVGHDSPIVSPYRGGRWTNRGVVVGPLGTAAWRIRDCQYDGLAQRRERVFVVADFGNGPDPVEVLFERQGVSRHPPTRREAWKGIARPADEGASVGGVREGSQGGSAFGGNNTSGPIEVATARTASHTASGRQDFETETFIVEAPSVANPLLAKHNASHRDDSDTYIATALRARDPSRGVDSDCTDTLIAVTHPLTTEGFDASEDGTGRGTPLIPVAYSIMPQNSGKDYKAREVDVAQPLMASGPVGGDQGGDYVVQPIAFSCKDHGADAGDISPTLRAMGHGATWANAGGQVAVAIPINPNALRGDSEAKTLSADAAGRLRLRDPGLGVGEDGDPADTLQTSGPGAVAFSLRGREGGAMAEVEGHGLAPAIRAAEGGSTRPFVACEVADSLTVGANQTTGFCGEAVATPDMAVRRITVVEAERLMGFRDGYTLIEWPTANRKGQDLQETIDYLIGHGYPAAEAERLAQTPDGPRYKALGNSKGVPTVRSIGRRYEAALTRHLVGLAE